MCCDTRSDFLPFVTRSVPARVLTFVLICADMRSDMCSVTNSGRLFWYQVWQVLGRLFTCVLACILTFFLALALAQICVLAQV